MAPGQLSGYAAFESPDPLYWTARGYAVVNADIPGSWHSGGNATFLSPEEAACGHDLIEWAARAGVRSGRPSSCGRLRSAKVHGFLDGGDDGPAAGRMVPRSARKGQ